MMMTNERADITERKNHEAAFKAKIVFEEYPQLNDQESGLDV